VANASENLKKYVKTSAKTAKKKTRELALFNKVPVHILQPLPDSVDLRACLSNIEKAVPRHLVQNIDVMYVGQFDHLTDNNVNASYSDGAIYLTNAQDDNADLIDDVVHEISHSIEQNSKDEIYGDREVENEFAGKRERLYHIINGVLPKGTNFPLEQYLNLEYDKDFDEFLYREIGYPTLTTISSGLFYSPYAITALREYFANGFEAYFLRDANYLKKISPLLFNKLEQLAYEG